MQQLQEQLTAQKVLKGQFTQTKTMQMFKQPLRSSGDFILSQEQGLIWQQNKPFLVSLVLANNKLIQQFSGQSAQVIEAKDNPMVFYFSHLFLSLFQGDLESLKTQFEMHLQATDNNWKLTLTPKVSPLDKVFKTITIQGDKYISSLLLTELNGDSSLIEFSNVQTFSTLSQQDLERFKI